MQNEPSFNEPTSTDLKERQLAYLNFPKSTVRARAVQILSTIYPTDPDVYAKIAPLVSDPSVKVRKYVVTAFARMKQQVSIPALCNIVSNQDEDENLRWQAAAVLGTFPPHSTIKETIPLLIASPQTLDNYVGLAILRSHPESYQGNHEPTHQAPPSPLFQRLGITEQSWCPTNTPKKPEPVRLDVAVREHILGSLWGAAIGDAMGGPIEFFTLRQIREKFGDVTSYVQRSPKRRPGKTSDDTFFNLAVLQCIAQTNGFDPDTFAASIAQTVRGIDAGASNPGIGPNTIRAGRLLYAGVDWRNLPFSYDTCGGAIRVGSIGAVYHAQPQLSKVYAAASSKVTHSHPDAIAGAIAAAAAVGYAINNQGRLDPHAFISYCADSCKDINTPFAEKIQRIESYLERPVETGLQELGTRNKAIDVVPAAIYAFLSSPNDFRQAIVNAIHVDGDSDSIGSVTGGIAGAYLGIRSIPPELLEGLQERSTIQKTIEECLAFHISYDLEGRLY